MDSYYLTLIALIAIIVILVILVIILFLKYRKLESKIYSGVNIPQQKEGIDDKYFEERIENIKKKLR